MDLHRSGKAVKESEKKSSRAAVRRAEEGRVRYDSIVESSDDAIIAMNPEGVIVAWNASAQRMFGYSESEAIGQPITIIIPPTLRAEETDILKRVRAGERIGHYETRRVSKKNKTMDVSITVSPVRDAGCKITGISYIARDITESNRAEAVLCESPELFRSVADSAPVMIWMSDVDKRCIYVNRRGLEFTGRALAAVLGSGWAEAVHPEDLQACLEIYAKAFDRREPIQMEYRLRRPDGEYRWILDHAVPRFNVDGSFVGYIGSGIDVTESKLAKEALQKSDERLRLAMEAGKSVGWDYTVKSGRVYTFGDLQVLGISAEDRDGSVEDLCLTVHPEDRSRVDEAIQRAMQHGKPYAAEFRLRWPDGTIRWVTAKGKVYYSKEGEPERMIGVDTDITDRKLAEQALRESEERFRLAAQAGRMYAFDWDVTTDEVVRSSEHATILGITEPLRSTHQQFLKRIHPDDRERLSATIAGLTPENPTGHIIYRVLAADGAFVWQRSSGRAIFDGEGKMLRVIGMVADITDLKRAEHALVEMTRKLVDAQEQERARIARELHDDICQRLALLTVELDQMRADRDKVSSTVRSRIGELRKQMDEISVDVQALSHDLHPSKLEHLGVVGGIKSWCKEFAKRQKIEVEFSTDVSIDPPLDVGISLFRVLQEALHNAVKHSGAMRVKVELREISNDVQLVIRDSGTGFDVETALGGRGLGLSSMRERVRLVNGTISIESKQMSGTTIHVRVPVESKYGSQGAAS